MFGQQIISYNSGLFTNMFRPKNDYWVGSDCCSVGRAVASTTRGPWFESSHCKFNIEHLFTVNCIEKMKIKNKRPGMDHIKKSWAIILGGKNCQNCLKRLFPVLFRYFCLLNNGPFFKKEWLLKNHFFCNERTTDMCWKCTSLIWLSKFWRKD